MLAQHFAGTKVQPDIIVPLAGAAPSQSSQQALPRLCMSLSSFQLWPPCLQSSSEGALQATFLPTLSSPAHPSSLLPQLQALWSLTAALVSPWAMREVRESRPSKRNQSPREGRYLSKATQQTRGASVEPGPPDHSAHFCGPFQWFL